MNILELDRLIQDKVPGDVYEQLASMAKELWSCGDVKHRAQLARDLESNLITWVGFAPATTRRWVRAFAPIGKLTPLMHLV